MELLPPVGWAEVATKHDLAALEERLALRFELVDQRFGALEERVDQRFGALEERLDQRFGAFEERVDQRFGAMEERVDQRFGTMDQRFQTWENRLLATFRAELLAQSNAISSQTRALIWANLGTVASMAALAFGVAKLT